jgi:ribonuclease HII
MNYYYINDIIEVGIDEAGRGPLFGRVYCGAVIWNPEIKTTLIKDSKKLSPTRRLEAYNYIRDNAIDYSVIWADEKTIDSENIYWATLSIMKKVVDKLTVRPDHILVDGNNFIPVVDERGRSIPHTCIEKGDNQYIQIAAASILAKVEHDKYIECMCDEHPELVERYDLRNNKGYGTKKHMEGLQRYGPSEWHRKSFKPCQ